ncbi:hypothetical protein [Ruminococcus flavefaciens]|uniref:hypothetical protein n=1 Tax=Ruminococcus flavefaciens TaxID=1265 RepID=UPI0026EEB48C|nr:hypothetical protein [Ruminococcus flavefaciens]
MGNEIYFDTVLGGYVKNDVLAKIDAYNALIDRISGMMISDAAINAELLKIRHMPLRKAKILFLPVSGFSVSQTDSYIDDLEREIADKVML